MAGPIVQTAIVTSDTLVHTGQAKVLWLAVSAGATGGEFQLNDSTDDSGTDLLNLSMPENSLLPPGTFADGPIEFKTGLYVDVPGTNLTINVGYVT